MCQLLHKVSSEYEIGYKVVVRTRKGNYKSPFMGCQYPKNGKVPVVKVQHPIAPLISQKILVSTAGLFEKEMTGRTAVFSEINGAVDLYKEIFLRRQYHSMYYTPVIVKVKMSKELMYGTYNGFGVYAGKHMEILEEIKEVEVKEDKPH